MNNMLKTILQAVKDKRIDKSLGYELIRQFKNASSSERNEKIAVIGMGFRLPKCSGNLDLWEIFRNGISTVDEVSKQRKDDICRYFSDVGREVKDFRTGSFLDRIDLFDYAFFDIPPKEAALLSPVQRIFLEVVIECIQDAGCYEKIRSLGKIGTYVGYADYLYENYGMMIHDHDSALLAADKLGNVSSMLLKRLYRFLGIEGPSMLIDTACSSAMTAVIEACDALRSRKVDLALAGGIRINNLPVVFQETYIGVESSDSCTRTFDEYADGAGVGEGVCSVMLKRLDDAVSDQDKIYAVIDGYSVSTESAGASLTAPTVSGQKKVILDAWNNAGILPENIGYIELHGTGTRLGDGIEFRALYEAFREKTSKTGFCAVGSAKSNFGHLHEAAGMLSFIKCLYILHYKMIPETLHFKLPNSEMDLVDSALYVSSKCREWNTDKPRIIGINSFGLSGTNCHLVLEEYSKNECRAAIKECTPLFHEKRCWYTDYIPNNKVQTYQYQWVNCEEKPFSTECDSRKKIYICSNPDEADCILINKLKQFADVRICRYSELDSTELAGNHLIFSLLEISSDSGKLFDKDLQMQICKCFLSLAQHNNRACTVRILGKNVFSIADSRNDGYKNSIYAGYIFVLAKECNFGRCVMLDADSENAELIAKTLLSVQEKYTAIRGNKTYERVFMKLPAETYSRLPMQEQVWVVIGGASGIGLECVKHLIRTKKVKAVAAIGRRNPDEIKDALTGIEQVCYYQTDICNHFELEQVFAAIMRAFGRIDGVINSAGLERDMLLLQRDENDLIYEDVLAPKVIGNENIISVVKKYCINDFILFSSIATIFPMIGQCDYAAANMYCEAMTDYYRSSGVNVRCLLWNTWAETGMAFRRNMTFDTIFKRLTIKQGVDIFDKFLSSVQNATISGIINDKRGKEILHNSSVMLSPALSEHFGFPTAQISSTVSGKHDLEEFVMRTKNSVQENIFGVINSFLGYDSFDYDASLFELGIDSVSFVKIQRQLSAFFKVELSIAELVENCSVSLLSSLIYRKCSNASESNAVREDEIIKSDNTERDDDIAVIGCSAMIPGCENRNDVIELLSCKYEFDTELKEIRKKDIFDYLDARNQEKDRFCFVTGSMFDRIDLFDAAFFGISPKEAAFMSPVQRMCLENAYHAIEDAGYAARIRKTRTAVLTAYSLNPKDSYGSMILELFPEEMAYAEFGNTTSVIAGRISHYFDLDGPAVNIDSACSSSVTAMHAAINGLKDNEYDYAVVQGIKLDILPVQMKNSVPIGTMSLDGKTRVFDESADGYGVGEGIITLILKRKNEAVRDHDHIYALLKSCAVNHNGKTRSIAAPSKTKQAALLRNVMMKSKVSSHKIDYVELHGTATVLGDNIEFEALNEVFQDNQKGRCPLGTLKASVGHLSEASGMFSIYKMLLMFQECAMFPNAGMVLPNAQLDLIGSPFYLNNRLRKWNDNPKTSLINCLGINGTNAQLIMQSYEKKAVVKDDKDGYIFVLSAKSIHALQIYCGRFYSFLFSHQTDSSDLSYTLCKGKEQFAFRMALVYRAQDMLCSVLKDIYENGFANNRCYINFDENGNIVRCREVPHNDDVLAQQCIDYVNDGLTSHMIPDDSSASVVPVPLYPFERKRFWLPLQKAYYYKIGWSKISRISDVNVSMCSEQYFIVSARNSETDWLLRDKFNKHVNYSFFQIDGDNFDELSYEICKAMDHPETHFVYVISQASEPDTISDLKIIQQNGVKMLNRFLNLLIDISKGRTAILSIVTENAVSICENEQNYLNSTVHGLGMCITHEYPNIRCRLCDVDSLPAFADYFRQILNQEINSFIGVRNDSFYIRTISKRMYAFGEKKYEVKRNAVYLITGASGGIGSCIADHLLVEGVYGLILIDSGRTKASRDKIRIRNEMLKHKCCYLKQYLIDVGDADSLRSVFQDIKDSNLELKGIFHCAGRDDAGLVINCSDEQYQQVFSAKVYASWLFKKLTADMHLDFILLFSSEVCTNGEAGMSVYTAGNFFMNELSNACSSEDNNIRSFLFTTWRDVGMGVRNHTNVDLIFRSMGNQQALNRLFQSLLLREQGIIIGDLNEEMLPMLTDKLRNVAFQPDPALTEQLLNQCSQTKNYELIGDIPEKSRSKLISGSKITDVTLHGADNFSRLQQNVGMCYSKVLGYDEIDIHSSFFELGGDSILMTRLNLLINEIYPQSVSLTDLYAYSTIYDLSVFIENKLKTEAKSDAETEKANPDETEHAVAIIGYSFHFPSCDSDEEMLELLKNGYCTVRTAPKKRRTLYNRSIKKYSADQEKSEDQLLYKNMSYLSDLDAFDFRFFDYEKEAADLAEPVQRLLLQSVYHAMEHAGYRYADFLNAKKLYYLAYSAFSMYSETIQRAKRTNNVPLMKNQASFICGEIAKRFGFQEEVAVIDTACSSALSAVHIAANRIRNTDKIAVISGVYTDVGIVEELAKNVGYESADGITRALDEYTTGAGAAEGVAAIVIKDFNKAREDGDFIHGVILSSAVGSNGYSAGITVPDQHAEEIVIDEAWRKSNVNPENLDYIELHGSGTPIGDSIEFHALKHVFEKYTKHKNFCGIGTIKNNIGHSFECAGLAGILKVLIMLKYHMIFQHPNLTLNNRKLDLIDSAMYIGSNRVVNKKQMICGVSSFGISGVNCHAVIAEGNRMETICEASVFPHILKLSAATHNALMLQLEKLISFIRQNPLLSHITYTLNTRRDDFSHRLFFVFSGKRNLLEQMQNALNNHDERFVQAENNVTDSDELRAKLRDYRVGHYSDRQTELLVQKRFLMGEPVPWDEIYDSHFQIIPLPGYEFEKDECWI